MAKKKEETVVEETTEQPKVDDTVEKIKVKKKPTMKKLSQDDEVVKVDLSKPAEEVISEETPVEEVVEEKQEEEVLEQNAETPVLEEVTEEEINEQVEEITVEAEKAITESMETGKELPENVQKLVDFMEETGGDINDYVKLNQDYSKLNESALLKEYYKQTKTRLDDEEINFLMEDQFSYDEDRDIRRKKLALKEQVANARAHLDGQKSKYYEDIKAGSKLTNEQQKAVDFFNRYNKESEATQKTVKTNTDIFTQKTNQVFNDKFKGFEYNVGDKKYRFNVNNAEEVKNIQSDSSNFMAKFVDKNLSLTDAKGYHKSLFTAMNSDAVANHFYEQGKADAMKDSVAKAKNVNMDPRQAHGEIEAGGVKVRVLGDDSSDFKFKIKQK